MEDCILLDFLLGGSDLHSWFYCSYYLSSCYKVAYFQRMSLTDFKEVSFCRHWPRLFTPLSVILSQLLFANQQTHLITVTYFPKSRLRERKELSFPIASSRLLMPLSVIFLQLLFVSQQADIQKPLTTKSSDWEILKQQVFGDVDWDCSCFRLWFYDS